MNNFKSLRGRLQADKDNHQDEIVGIQENYNSKIKTLINENKIECETLKERISELEDKLFKSKEITKPKNDDDMWGLNENEPNLTEVNVGNFEQELKMKNEEIVQLQYQVIYFKLKK